MLGINKKNLAIYESIHRALEGLAHQCSRNRSKARHHPPIDVPCLRPNFRGSVSGWFAEAGLVPNIVISVPCFTIVPTYLKLIDAIAFLPSKALLGGELKVLDLEQYPLSFKVAASWPTRSEKDPVHNWIVNLLRARSQIGVGADGQPPSLLVVQSAIALVGFVAVDTEPVAGRLWGVALLLGYGEHTNHLDFGVVGESVVG